MSTNGVNLYKDINAETFDQKRAKKLGMLAKLFHFLLDKESRPVQWCVCVFERERVKKGKEREICRERERHVCLPTFTHVGMNMHVHMCASTCVSVQIYVGTNYVHTEVSTQPQVSTVFFQDRDYHWPESRQIG